MKLTEQQLAQIFQHSKDTAVESVMDDLNEFSEASNARLNAVETIANNSTLSAGQHIINNMEEWTQSLTAEIQEQSKPALIHHLLKWLRPTVAVAAVVSAVYFIAPIEQQSTKPQTMQITHQTTLQAQKPDRIMYTSSFEQRKNPVQSSHDNKKPDVIVKFDFS